MLLEGLRSGPDLKEEHIQAAEPFYVAVTGYNGIRFRGYEFTLTVEYAPAWRAADGPGRGPQQWIGDHRCHLLGSNNMWQMIRRLQILLYSDLLFLKANLLQWTLILRIHKTSTTNGALSRRRRLHVKIPMESFNFFCLFLFTILWRPG